MRYTNAPHGSQCIRQKITNNELYQELLPVTEKENETSRALRTSHGRKKIHRRPAGRHWDDQHSGTENSNVGQRSMEGTCEER